jgi:hypothetical protein
VLAGALFLGDCDRITVAIERPDGRLVDTQMEAGNPVVPVNPNAIKTWREAGTGSSPKPDAGAAQVIADYLRCRAHRLASVVLYSAKAKALCTVVCTREDPVGLPVAATNQLAALLDALWPAAKAIFADVESPIALEFLTRYPTARHALHRGVKKGLAAFCTKHGYWGRRRAEQLAARLRAGSPGTTDEALRDAVQAIVAVPKNLDYRVAATLGEHPHSEFYMSLARSGEITAAEMLAE